MPSPEVQRLAHWGGSVPLRVTTREISVGTTTPSSDLTASIFSGQARLLWGRAGGWCVPLCGVCVVPGRVGVVGIRGLREAPSIPAP